MPQSIADQIEFTIGQTEPVTFKLYTKGQQVVSLSGATVKLSIWNGADDDALWDFDATNATTTIASDEISWSPADEDVFSEAGHYFGQLQITWGSGKIEYVPRDFHDFPWVVYPNVEEGN